MQTLRDLLVQRAARLQDRPALTAPGWGTLTWGAWRSRVEGVALGLLAEEAAVGQPVHSALGNPWDWAAEVAAACCGLRWDPDGRAIGMAVLGGPCFNAEAGRGPYHDRERALEAATAFLPGVSHGELLARLRRVNGSLGWDHDTREVVPLQRLSSTEGRGTLWSLLYAGGHAVLAEAGPVACDLRPFQTLFQA